MIDARINWCEYDNDRFILSLYKNRSFFLIFDLLLNSYIFVSKDLKKGRNRLQHISNAKIVEIKQRGFDRLLTLSLVKRKPSGKLIQMKLIFEVVGKISNVFLLDEKGKIIFRWNDNNIDGDREINLGNEYIPFKSNKKYNLLNIRECDDFEQLEGFYRITAKHAAEIYNNFGNCEKAKDFILNSLNSDDSFYLDGQNKLIPFKILSYKEKIKIDLLDQYLVSLKKVNNRSDHKFLKIKNFYVKKKASYEKLLMNLYKDLKEARNYEKYHEEAELLKNNLSKIKGKTGEVLLDKFNENGVEQVKYYIDPGESVLKKIENLYGRAEKLKRSLEKLSNRIDEVKRMISYYDEEMFNLENMSMDEINKLYEELFVLKSNKVKEVGSIPYLTFKKDDTLFFLGKNSRSNHYVVFKVANPDDYWFHAHEIPSAHLILRKESPVDEEDIITAARITAAFSKYKNEKRVPVDYTLRKYVKKPKGTPEGFVIYKNYKTIYVEPFSEKELENLRG
ncbi:NFACT RNA binding domain-containing protein [Deferribacter autotrophicus]|uniref:NFACT RNA binding domain-containing protein n=1 Tax=Deferribacter autotrophicus TaxID=500465 RepID=UPI00165DA0E4|nr:NFACT RNA binding domain-containing protein [Deferribacter autotrophicus]